MNAPLPSLDKHKCPGDQPPRRAFFRWITGALGAVATGLLTLPMHGYFFGRRNRPAMWVPMGSLADFPLGETRTINFDNPLRQPWDGMTSMTGVHVRYQGQNDDGEEQFLVLAANCAHLGCPVSWFPDERESEFTETSSFATTRSGSHNSTWAYERAQRKRKARINRVVVLVLAAVALSTVVLYAVAKRLHA